MNIGSVTTTRSGTEVVYPLGTADCGVRQFTDCWEIWLEAAVNYEPGHDGPMPRVDGSVFIDSFDESLLSEGELKIRQPELFPDLDDRSQATFTMYSGDPSLIGPCVFRFLKFDGEHVQVHWEGTIDPSLGEESSLSSEFSLEANFRYHGVTDTGLPSSALAIEGSCLFLLVCVALEWGSP